MITPDEEEMDHDRGDGMLKCSLDDELSMAAEIRPTPAARRTRLAALANTINNWEDDLSRPVIK